MNRLYAVILLFITTISFHCQKEVNYINNVPGSPGNNSPGPITATVQGNIVDENDQPAAGVTIKAGNKNATTDAKGYFRIVNADLDRNASLLVAEKNGYFKAYRSFSASKAANNVKIKLIRKELAGTIPASGGEVTLSNGAKVALSSGSVVKATGGDYSGDIKVFAAYIDPTATDIGMRVPGSFMADNSAKERVTLASFGMLAVELESGAAEQLQIAGGKHATLTMPVPASLRSVAPATISLWYVDEKTGIWKEEGTATRSGNNYVGDVKHFSFWNCDIGLPAVMLTLTLKSTEGMPLVHTYVRIKGTANGVPSYGAGFTDSLGTVSGLVLSGQSLALEVLSDQCSSPAYSTTIGPFTNNTDLGVITVNPTNNSIVTIKGVLLNCDGDPVTDGAARINIQNSTAYVSTNSSGEFSLAYVKCDNSAADLTVIGLDETTAQESGAQVFTLTAPVTNTGTITACGTSSTQFITYKIDGTDFGFSNGIAMDSIIIYTQLIQQPTPHYQTTFYATSFLDPKRIFLSFESAAQTAGTYPMLTLTVNQYSEAEIVSPTNVIVTKFPQTSGQFYEGSFSGQFRDSLGQDPVHTISGNFRLRRP